MKPTAKLFIFGVACVSAMGLSAPSASAFETMPPPDCVGCTSEQTCDYVDTLTEPGWRSCEIFSFEGEWWCNTVGNASWGIQQLEELASQLGGDGSHLRQADAASAESIEEYREGGMGRRSCDGTLLQRSISASLGVEMRNGTRVLTF